MGFSDDANTEWEPPSLELLVSQARKAKGAAGPDYWSGVELKHLSEGALATFRCLALQWEAESACPEQLTHSRQVNLPKNSKVVNSHVDVSDVRPIAVMSAFWRLWGFSCIKSENAFGKGPSD